MLDYNSEIVEQGLLTLVNSIIDGFDIGLEEDEYYKVSFNIWENHKLQNFLDTFKFEVIGNAHKFPNILPQKNAFYDSDIYLSYEKTDVIAISEKYNAIAIYSVQKYYVKILMLIDKENYSKFNKKVVPLLESNKSSGIFNSVNFKCKKKEYIEVSSPMNDEDKIVSIQKKKLPKENLVYDTESGLFNVMNDIKLFFKKDTKELYKKMNILYKRGVIIHGEPGNGKTAMIREIIRQLSNVTTIIINPNTPRVTFVLSELINALKEKPTIIVIEDIDSVILNNNRSEFLNILDGINMKSGIYFIGTSNYPERIDPAFVNRSGRFDRMYKIPNPNENIRRAFFRSCKIGDILTGYKIHKDNSDNTELNIVDLFVKYSDDLSMANLKELMISTQYMLISDNTKSIEEALETNYNTLKNVKSEHDSSHNEYEENYHRYRPNKVFRY